MIDTCRLLHIGLGEIRRGTYRLISEYRKYHFHFLTYA